MAERKQKRERERESEARRQSYDVAQGRAEGSTNELEECALKGKRLWLDASGAQGGVWMCLGRVTGKMEG
jgi:hypothetical protein